MLFISFISMCTFFHSYNIDYITFPSGPTYRALFTSIICCCAGAIAGFLMFSKGYFHKFMCVSFFSLSYLRQFFYSTIFINNFICSPLHIGCTQFYILTSTFIFYILIILFCKCIHRFNNCHFLCYHYFGIS